MYSQKYISSICDGLRNTIHLIKNKEISSNDFFKKLVLKTKEVKKDNGRIFFFGNGASSSFSNHMSLDWSKNGGILSFSLSDSSMLTALANDYNYQSSFVEFLKIYQPTKNDLVVTTSSSGNSKNIVSVLNFCKKNNITTLAFSGLNLPNKSLDVADFSIYVPMKTYGMVECIHQIFHHLWLDNYMKIEDWNKLDPQNMDSLNFKL